MSKQSKVKFPSIDQQQTYSTQQSQQHNPYSSYNSKDYNRSTSQNNNYQTYNSNNNYDIQEDIDLDYDAYDNDQGLTEEERYKKLLKKRYPGLKFNQEPVEKTYNFKTSYDDNRVHQEENQLTNYNKQKIGEQLQKEKTKISKLSMTKYGQLSEFLPRSSVQYIPDLGKDARKKIPFIGNKNIGYFNKIIVDNEIQQLESQQTQNDMNIQEEVEQQSPIKKRVHSSQQQLQNSSILSKIQIQPDPRQIKKKKQQAKEEQQPKSSVDLNVPTKFFNQSYQKPQTQNNLSSSKLDISKNTTLNQNIKMQNSRYLNNTLSQQHSPIKQRSVLKPRSSINVNLTSDTQKTIGDIRPSSREYDRIDLLEFQLDHNKFQIEQSEYLDYKNLSKSINKINKFKQNEEHKEQSMKKVKQYPSIKQYMPDEKNLSKQDKFQEYLRKFQNDKKQLMRKASQLNQEIQKQELLETKKQESLNKKNQKGSFKIRTQNQNISPTRKKNTILNLQKTRQSFQGSKSNFQETDRNQQNEEQNGIIFDPFDIQQDIVFKVRWQEIKNYQITQWKPPAREGHSIVFSKNKCFMYGGFGVKDMNELNEIVTYDPSIEKWQKVDWDGDLPRYGRAGHTMDAYKNLLILYGGQEKRLEKVKNCVNDVKIINTDNMKVTHVLNQAISMAPRINHASCIVGKILLIMGGENRNGNLLKDFWQFDLTSLKWNEVNILYNDDQEMVKDKNGNYIEYEDQQSPFFYGITYHKMVHVSHPERRGQVLLYHNLLAGQKYNLTFENQKNERIKKQIKHEGIYMFGGIDSKSRVQDKLWYIPVDTKPLGWQVMDTIGKQPCGRYQHSMDFCVKLNSIVIYGGREGKYDKALNDVHILNLGDMEWQTVEIFGHAQEVRSSHKSFMQDTRLYIFGGMSSHGYTGNEIQCLELDQRIVEEKVAKDKEEEQIRQEILQYQLEKLNAQMNMNTRQGVAPSELVSIRNSKKAQMMQKMDPKLDLNNKNISVEKQRLIDKISPNSQRNQFAKLNFDNFKTFIPQDQGQSDEQYQDYDDEEIIQSPQQTEEFEQKNND